MKKILLVEPDYINKYPPLGLMKISTFHKRKKHNVKFVKGLSAELKNKKWDRIYVSSLFTFYWNKTIKTIKYYQDSLKNGGKIYVGGVMASLMQKEIEEKTKAKVIVGLLNKKKLLGYADDNVIDTIIPDYSIINTKQNSYLNYDYPTSNSYLAYATRGCIRKCSFCAVHKIEPKFSNSLSIKKQVNAIKDKFGEKKDLLLMDNNILASSDFDKIINEIKELGYEKNAKSYYLNSKHRKIYFKKYVDFNQGVDARLLTDDNMKLLGEIAVKPLRIAFDNLALKDIYIEKVRLAAKYGIETLSNYILFNFEDQPDDFYQRLKINIELNEEFKQQGIKTSIWSFPMRYSPITGENCKDRKFIGKHWNKKYLRGIQCILLATHGVVGPKRSYFETAFGKDYNEFKSILSLPEDYIIYRKRNLNNGNIRTLNKAVEKLSPEERNIFYDSILNKKKGSFSLNQKIQDIISEHYKEVSKWKV